jgi:cardiolipin synthase
VPTISSPLCGWLRRLIRGAKKSVYLTMAYFVPDDPLIEDLCDAAKRGVRVRLMLPGRSDVKAVKLASHAFYEKLMNSGVEIYERQAVVLHAKTIVIDGCCSVIGSTNLDTRSIEFNLEISSIIRNAEFGRQMHDLFENDVKYARRIDLATWRKRPWQDKVIQWAVSRARYLL